MINFFKIAVVFILMHLCGTLSAQYTLDGRVLDISNDEPLEGVEVYHHNTAVTIKTDSQGVFVLGNLWDGENIFTLFSPEFELKTDTIDIENSLSKTFKLSQWNLSLDRIDVVAKRKEYFAIKRLNDIEGTSIFAGKKTEVVVMDLVNANLANNNSRQIYAQVSGLNIYEGNDGGIQLNIGGRGLDPNRTSNFNTRQNGYDISADVLGYPENYYTPPSEAISEIRIIRGASSLQYGTQFGGLVDFRLRQIPSYKNVEFITTQSLGSFGAVNSFNYLGLRKGKFSISSFYNYKKGNGYRPNSNYEAHNAFVNADYKFSDKTQLSFDFTYFTYLAKQAGGLTDTQFASNPRLSTRDRNWFKVDWLLYNLKLKHTFSKNTFLSLSLFSLDASRKSVGYRGNPININESPITSIDERDSNGQYILPRDLILGNFKNYGAELKFLKNYSLGDKRSTFLIGSKYFKSNNTAVQGPGSAFADADFELYTSTYSDYANQSDFNFPNRNLSLFSENIIYFSDKLSIVPGVRFEHIKTVSEGVYNQLVFDNAGNAIANNELEDNRSIERNFVLAGFGMSWKKSKSLEWTANLSQNYRSVTFSDIRVVSPSFKVDADIKDESGFTFDTGIRGRLDKILSYDFTIYSMLYNDRIGIVLDDRANRVRKNIGQAVIAGTETLVTINALKLWSPNDQNKDLNLFANAAFTYSKYLESEESNVVGNTVEFIPSVNLKTGVSYRLRNFEASYQFTYLSQQFTDVQNSAAAIAGDKRDGLIGSIPAFSVSDAHFSYRFRRMKLAFSINNLWDQSYFTRRALGYPGPGIIPSEGRAFFISLTYSNKDS